MPASDKRLAANRANARHSTGPRTPEGKARCSRNRTSHGLYARELHLPEYWETRARHFAAEARHEFRTHPPLADLVAQRVLLRIRSSYLNRLLNSFCDAFFASPDPSRFRNENHSYFRAIARHRGRLLRQTRILDRLILPLLLEFESAQAARPQARAAGQVWNDSDPTPPTPCLPPVRERQRPAPCPPP